MLDQNYGVVVNRSCCSNPRYLCPKCKQQIRDRHTQDMSPPPSTMVDNAAPGLLKHLEQLEVTDPICGFPMEAPPTDGKPKNLYVGPGVFNASKKDNPGLLAIPSTLPEGD